MYLTGPMLRDSVHKRKPDSQQLRRTVARRPVLALFLIFASILAAALGTFELLLHGDLGRWYYNYALTLTPDSFVKYIPHAGWQPTRDPPRWVQEIHDSRWMGNWNVPVLSKPRWRDEGSKVVIGEQHVALHDLPARHPHTLSRRLSSSAILKFHVFSAAVSESGYEKRHLIRRLSPMYQLPPAYRHLIDVKFVMGYNFLDNWGPPLNETMESRIREEEREYGDILRLPDLWRGENLREGKILQWIRDTGEGKDGRDAWYLFKVDDDAVINVPKLLDLLLGLDVRRPTYLGTSLVRWPPYHNHFTGLLTGFNYGLYKTLAQGISKMSQKEVQLAWDDDVLTGELMYCLPSAPHCQHNSTGLCDAHRVPKHGWMPLPENPDPRTDLYRHDFLRRAGDPAWIGTKGDLAMHGWWFKFCEYWEKEWNRAIRGTMWEPPGWIVRYADSDSSDDRYAQT